VERTTGLEPAKMPAWKAGDLPLIDVRGRRRGRNPALLYYLLGPLASTAVVGSTLDVPNLVQCLLPRSRLESLGSDLGDLRIGFRDPLGQIVDLIL
jgi:hypothetical protein